MTPAINLALTLGIALTQTPAIPLAQTIALTEDLLIQ